MRVHGSAVSYSVLAGRDVLNRHDGQCCGWLDRDHQGEIVRWEELFADMEAQLAQAEQRSVELEAAETARAELSRLTLAERLSAHRNQTVRLLPAHGDVLEGELTDIGAGWAVIRERYFQHLVPLHSVVWWEGLYRRFEMTNERAVLRKLGMGHVLRALAASRTHVRVLLLDPSSRGDVEGTLDAVGHDFFDLALHPNDQFRRRHAVKAVRTVPFSSVALISSPDSA